MMYLLIGIGIGWVIRSVLAIWLVPGKQRRWMALNTPAAKSDWRAKPLA